MSNNYNIIKEKNYNHLSLPEREIIDSMLHSNKKQSEIALVINRDKSTISRELNRNSSNVYNCYKDHIAQNRADERNSIKHKKIRLKNKMIQKYVINKLKLDLSPEQISGRLRIDHPNFKTNYESIYQYIYYENQNMIKYLPQSHKKRKKRYSAKNKRAIRIPNRIMIDKRPKKINERKEYGHWEADTVISRHSKNTLQILQERKSKLLKITKINSKSSKETSNAINNKLSKTPKKLVKTITYDNGTENVEHERVNKILGTKSYFCHPYNSWEKGGVENIIGLIRRYLPKKTDFAKISKYKIKIIENRLNNRPRKCLKYRTPNEVFNSVALAY